MIFRQNGFSIPEVLISALILALTMSYVLIEHRNSVRFRDTIEASQKIIEAESSLRAEVISSNLNGIQNFFSRFNAVGCNKSSVDDTSNSYAGQNAQIGGVLTPLSPFFIPGSQISSQGFLFTVLNITASRGIASNITSLSSDVQQAIQAPLNRCQSQIGASLPTGTQDLLYFANTPGAYFCVQITQDPASSMTIVGTSSLSNLSPVIAEVFVTHVDLLQGTEITCPYGSANRLLVLHYTLHWVARNIKGAGLYLTKSASLYFRPI